MSNFSTLPELIDFIGKKYHNPTAFNFLENNKWRNISTQEFATNIHALACGLRTIGLERNDGFGIVSYQNPLWLMIDFACIASGGISVPIFSNISEQNLLFELNNANVKFIFLDSLESLRTIQNSGQNFKKIIIQGFDYKGENIITFTDLLNLGIAAQQKNPQLYQDLTGQINENDLATIIYTSGSTGTPKGVEITHKNLISQIAAAEKFFPLNSTQDVALSFLPLAHIFERMVVSYYISSGISIYFADDVKNVGILMKEIKPTLMTVVPRILEKVFTKMNNNVNEASPIKRVIGNLAFSYALKKNPDDKNFSNLIILSIFDCLVYKKLRNALGGKFRMMICGGAPLSLPLEQFFKNIGINLFIGYGTTESSPVIAANCAKFNKTGTIGKAFDGVEVKTDENGELLARGPNIMRGYHRDLLRTSETITPDGWLKTGDLATIDRQGYIKIIGRKKELFKTANGKYVSPVPIEQKLLAGWQLLTAACIIAEGRKFVSCLLFVEWEMLEKYQKKVGLEHLSHQDFLNGDFVKKRAAKLIEGVNKNLNHWEQIQKYYLARNPISIKTGELTPSMKLRRNVVEEKYRDEIEKFYQE